MASQPCPSGDWLSLTDLGRVYGISAVQCGRLLQTAGLRQRDGAPSRRALRGGLAQQAGRHRGPGGTLWSRGGCGALLEEQGLESAAERRLVRQWADLLEALQNSHGAVSTSAEELASDLPGHLVGPVNAALRQRGCPLQLEPSLEPSVEDSVQPGPQASRRASACWRARSSSSRSWSSSA